MNDNVLLALKFGVIVLSTVLIALVFRKLITLWIKKSQNSLGSDPTRFSFLKHSGNAFIYMVGFGFAIYTIPAMKALGTAIFASASLLAVVVGFASQQALGNIISGLFIIVFKPFRINDRLNIQTYKGIVEDITLRHTVIRDLENKRIIIPNLIIGSEIIVNADFAEENICKWIDVGISYSSDIDLAKSIIEDEVLKHPFHIDPRKPEQIEAGEPEVPVRVVLLGESSVNLRAWAWAKDTPNSFVMACDLFESIKKRFDREGIEIPFPHRTVYMKSEPSKSKP